MKFISPNHREVLYAVSSITGEAEYLTSTNHVLDSTGGGGGSDVNLVSVGGSSIALGQTTMANSLPITIASNQSALSVTATGGDLTSGNQQIQGNIESGSTDFGNPVKVGGVYNATNPTVTTGQRVDFQTDSRGNLKVVPTSGSNIASFGADNADGVTVSATADKQRIITRNSVYNGTTWDRMYGDSTNGVWVNVKNIPAVTANPSAWNVSSQTSLTTTATVSGSAGRFGGGSFLNLNSAPAYIQVFDTTGAVTLGTTVPTFVQPIPANSSSANGSGFVFELSRGITMSSGIKIAATTTPTGATTVSTALTGYIVYT
jgi:hypothetical protein